MRSVIVAALLALGTPALADKSPIDAFYDAWLAAHPFEATELGIHEHDKEVQLVDDASLARWAKALRKHRAAIAKVPSGCDAACKVDHEVVVQQIDSELFDLEMLRPLDRWPDSWVSLATAAVFPLVKRSFAPLPERAQSVVARLHALGKQLALAPAHLSGKRSMVAPAAVDIALADLHGATEFIGTDVPKAFETLPQDQRAAVQHAVDEAVAALNALGKHLEGEVRRSAKSEIAIGPKLLAGKLLADEMIDEPLDALLARGEMELYRLQTAFKAQAHNIDPSRDFHAVKDELGRDHAPRAAILGEIQARLALLKKFLVDRKIVTVPSDVMPIVDETPPFLRSMTQASMDSPGPFEKDAHEAYFHVTLPELTWPAARVEDYLAGSLSRPTIDVVAIHETFPGHYLQFLWMSKLPSRVRRMSETRSNVEGWAHYCEQMMLDSGFLPDKPFTRLAQLDDALLRAARYVVAIRMHAKSMTVAEAERFFVDEGLQSHEVAIIEAKRATEDPTFLYYTWGKLQLLALREELMQKWGKDFSLQRFHDAVMAQGAIPLPLLRRALTE